jgi:hypothetical protein
VRRLDGALDRQGDEQRHNAGTEEERISQCALLLDEFEVQHRKLLTEVMMGMPDIGGGF